MVYKVRLQKGGLDLEVVYWSGALNEIILLARSLAVRVDADLFRIIEFTVAEAEVHLETSPFDRKLN